MSHMKLRNIVVESPEDVLYPCGRDLFEDPYVVYHGTSRVYTTTIERDGWLPNSVPYVMADVELICHIYESIAFNGTSAGGYAVLRGFSLGNDRNYCLYKPASFSESYWRARNYATRRAGETVDSIILALDDLHVLLRDPARREQHKNALCDKYDERKKSLNHALTEHLSAIERMNKPDYLNRCLQDVTSIRDKYFNLAEGHSPVVYCVRAQLDLLETLNGTKWEGTDLADVLDRNRFEQMTELRPKQGTQVPPECIIARIDFPTGACRWLPSAGRILPLPWLVTKQQADEMWQRQHGISRPEEN